MKKYLLLVGLLVMMSALFVGCDADITTPSGNSNTGQTTSTTISQGSSDNYNSEFVDESDDVTIGEMV